MTPEARWRHACKELRNARERGIGALLSMIAGDVPPHVRLTVLEAIRTMRAADDAAIEAPQTDQP